MALYYAYHPDVPAILEKVKTTLASVSTADTYVTKLVKEAKRAIERAGKDFKIDVSEAEVINAALKDALAACSVEADKGHIGKALGITEQIEAIARSETRHPLHIDKALEAKLRVIREAMETIRGHIPEEVQPGRDPRLKLQYDNLREKISGALEALDHADNDHLITAEESRSLVELLKGVTAVCRTSSTLGDQTLAEGAEKAMKTIHKRAGVLG